MTCSGLRTELDPLGLMTRCLAIVQKLLIITVDRIVW